MAFDFGPGWLGRSWRAWVSSSEREVGLPTWLMWFWTLVFSTGMGLFFTVLGMVASGGAWGRSPVLWLTWLGRNLVVSWSIGLCIHLLFLLAYRLAGGPRRVRAWGPRARTSFHAAIPFIGVLLGWPLGLALLGGDVLRWVNSDRGWPLIGYGVLLSAVVTTLMHIYFTARMREAEAERRASEAQLQLLQAQMEPHFLFNTLAGIIATVEADPPAARARLQAFTDHLRASLGSLRRTEVTLAEELAVVETYLALMQARMEERLNFRIDADATARACLLPPLSLQPLVENAVLHGLEPTVEGGTVSLHARCVDGTLEVVVADDGRGAMAWADPRQPPQPAAGHGLALDNLRRRLAARHGHAASLSLAPAHPGTRATLRLPAVASAAGRVGAEAAAQDHLQRFPPPPAPVPPGAADERPAA